MSAGRYKIIDQAATDFVSFRWSKKTIILETM